MNEPKPETSLKYNEPGFQGGMRDETRIETVWGKIRVVSAVPTWTPKGTQEDSMALYVNGTTQRLYFYDFTNNVWRFFTHTTVAADGESALEGDIEIAGNGIEVTQAGQTITIGSGSPFVGKANDSYSSTEGDPHKDITFAVGFDPKMIWFYGQIDDASLSTVLHFNAQLRTNIVQVPCIWIDDAYLIGYRQQSANPIVWSDITSALVQTDLEASNWEFKIVVQSHDSANTVIRLERLSGTGTVTVHYKFFIIAFP